MFVTHNSRFQKSGDYRTYEIAGFSFIVILGKDKQLRAFHNVCRHRAYAVTKKESGSSTVLGCRYHGWSYDTNGKLIKAPEFENVAGFDKAMNGLWELKTEVRVGLVFVNFQVGSGEPELNLGDSESVMKKWRIGEMKWAHGWKAEGAFNWKLAGQSFYKSRTPSVNNSTAETFIFEISKKDEASYWETVLPALFEVQETDIALSHATFARRLSSGRILTVRLLPITANKTSVEYNIYGRNSRHTKATQLELESTKKEFRLMIERTELEQHELVEGAREIQNCQWSKL
jgi:nitrite reductase/ring-hydroxylating ferredoxin subunit